MLRNEKEAKAQHMEESESLSKKIISKMALITAAVFLVTVLMAAFLAAKSLIRVNREKLAAVAYENAFLVVNDIENAYGKVEGFSGSLRNISILDPKEQRDAIDTALEGLMEGTGDYTTGFAYFEQNAIADANGEPYSVHKKEIAYEAVVYPNEENTGYVFEKHEDAFDNFDKEYYRTIKETGQVYIMEPYIYQLHGEDIMMISVIAPVYDAEGEFFGVAGCDVALQDMQSRRYAATGYNSTHIMILTENGTVLLDSSDPSRVGKTAAESGYEAILSDAEALRTMEEGTFSNSNFVLHEKTVNYATGNTGLSILVPLKVGRQGEWALYVAVDKGEFDAKIRKDTIQLSFAVIFFGVLLLTIIYFIIRKSLRIRRWLFRN